MANTINGLTEWDDWRNRPGNDFIHQVESGRLGRNIGLRNGLIHVNNFIYGTQRARYYLIGADSGVGKTTLADFMFVLQAYKAAKQQDRKLRIFYCSFEIGRADKIARWTSYYIFQMHKIRLPSDYILGRVEGVLLSAEHAKLVRLVYEEIKIMFDECVEFIDMEMSPNMIFNGIVEEHFAKRGKIQYDPSGKKITGYIADNPEYMTMLLVDHLALTEEEEKDDTKRTVDKLSRKAVILRNIFGCTIVFIQQFSTDMLMANRTMHTKKSGIASIAPTRLDFGDTKAPYRDADVVMGAICPGRDLAECEGYDLSPNMMGLNMILLFIMKNRYGRAGKFSPLFMDGITGIFADLPFPANKFQASVIQGWYDEAQKIEQICHTFSPRLS